MPSATFTDPLTPALRMSLFSIVVAWALVITLKEIEREHSIAPQFIRLGIQLFTIIGSSVLALTRSIALKTNLALFSHGIRGVRFLFSQLGAIQLMRRLTYFWAIGFVCYLDWFHVGSVRWAIGLVHIHTVSYYNIHPEDFHPCTRLFRTLTNSSLPFPCPISSFRDSPVSWSIRSLMPAVVVWHSQAPPTFLLLLPSFLLPLCFLPVLPLAFFVTICLFSH